MVLTGIAPILVSSYLIESVLNLGEGELLLLSFACSERRSWRTGRPWQRIHESLICRLSDSLEDFVARRSAMADCSLSIQLTPRQGIGGFGSTAVLLLFFYMKKRIQARMVGIWTARALKMLPIAEDVFFSERFTIKTMCKSMHYRESLPARRRSKYSCLVL